MHIVRGRVVLMLLINVCYRTVVCLSVCLSVCPVCPVCNAGVLWANGWTDQDETRHKVGLGPGHIVLESPNFPLISVVVKCLDGSRCHFGSKVGVNPIATLC